MTRTTNPSVQVLTSIYGAVAEQAIDTSILRRS